MSRLEGIGRRLSALGSYLHRRREGEPPYVKVFWRDGEVSKIDLGSLDRQRDRELAALAGERIRRLIELAEGQFSAKKD